MPDDSTFLSRLEKLLDEFEIGLMSSTDSKTLAEMIQGWLGAFNLAMLHRDKQDGTYADKRVNSIIDSQQKDLEKIKYDLIEANDKKLARKRIIK